MWLLYHAYWSLLFLGGEQETWSELIRRLMEKSIVHFGKKNLVVVAKHLVLRWKFTFQHEKNPKPTAWSTMEWFRTKSVNVPEISWSKFNQQSGLKLDSFSKKTQNTCIYPAIKVNNRKYWLTNVKSEKEYMAFEDFWKEEERHLFNMCFDHQSFTTLLYLMCNFPGAQLYKWKWVRSDFPSWSLWLGFGFGDRKPTII